MGEGQNRDTEKRMFGVVSARLMLWGEGPRIGW